MALGDPYATVAQYYADAREGETAPTDVADPDYVAVLSALTGSARYLDKALARPLGFNKDGTATARYYVAPAPRGRMQPGWAESENPWKASGARRCLDIDDYVSVSAIAIDENRDNTFSTSLTTNDYLLLPLNAATGPEARPYHQIELTDWGSQWAWTPGARVRVTGIGGWPAVPAAIKIANIELARLLRIETPRATNQVAEGINTVLGASRQAQDIVSRLSATYRHVGAYL